MADVAKRDDNNIPSLLGTGDDSDAEVLRLLVDPDNSRLKVTTEDTEAVATKAIEALTQDINAAAYSASTVHTSQYKFIGLLLKFSTAQSKTITLSLSNGTVDIPLWTKASDTATSRVFLPDKDWLFPADWELKLEISQTAGACTASILLLTRI